MKDFIKYLKKKYNAPNLSKTQFKNKLISSNFELINFEEMSNDVPKLDNNALFISKFLIMLIFLFLHKVYYTLTLTLIYVSRYDYY